MKGARRERGTFRGRRWLPGALVLGAALLVLPFFVHRTLRYYTDGIALRREAKVASGHLRDVLWSEPVRLGPAVNTADLDEYEPRVSPDGSLLIFTRGRPGANADLWSAQRGPDGWGEARPIAELDGPHDEVGGAFARLEPASRRLLFVFSSNRPGGAGGYDLWWAVLAEDGSWSAPAPLGLGVNTPWTELSPAIAADGAYIVFLSTRLSGTPADPPRWRGTVRETLDPPRYDIFRAPRVPAEDVVFGEAALVESLSDPVHSEGSLAISESGDFLYFSSEGRDHPAAQGGYDLLRARLSGGRLGTPESLGPPVNTPLHELDPALASAGFELLFSRRDPGTGRDDIWTSTSREVYLDVVAGDTYWSHEAVLAFLLRLLRSVHPAVLALILSAIACLIFLVLFGRRISRMAILARCFVIALLVHSVIALWMNAREVKRVLVAGLGQGDQEVEVFDIALDGEAEEDVAYAVRNETASTATDRPPVLEVRSGLPDSVFRPAPSPAARAALRLDSGPAPLRAPDAERRGARSVGWLRPARPRFEEDAPAGDGEVHIALPEDGALEEAVTVAAVEPIGLEAPPAAVPEEPPRFATGRTLEVPPERVSSVSVPLRPEGRREALGAEPFRFEAPRAPAPDPGGDLEAAAEALAAASPGVPGLYPLEAREAPVDGLGAARDLGGPEAGWGRLEGALTAPRAPARSVRVEGSVAPLERAAGSAPEAPLLARAFEVRPRGDADLPGLEAAPREAPLPGDEARAIAAVFEPAQRDAGPPGAEPARPDEPLRLSARAPVEERPRAEPLEPPASLERWGVEGEHRPEPAAVVQLSRPAPPPPGAGAPLESPRPTDHRGEDAVGSRLAPGLPVGEPELAAVAQGRSLRGPEARRERSSEPLESSLASSVPPRAAPPTRSVFERASPVGPGETPPLAATPLAAGRPDPEAAADLPRPEALLAPAGLPEGDAAPRAPTLARREPGAPVTKGAPAPERLELAGGARALDPGEAYAQTPPTPAGPLERLPAPETEGARLAPAALREPAAARPLALAALEGARALPASLRSPVSLAATPSPGPAPLAGASARLLAAAPSPTEGAARRPSEEAPALAPLPPRSLQGAGLAEARREAGAGARPLSLTSPSELPGRPDAGARPPRLPAARAHPEAWAARPPALPTAPLPAPVELAAPAPDGARERPVPASIARAPAARPAGSPWAARPAVRPREPGADETPPPATRVSPPRRPIEEGQAPPAVSAAELSARATTRESGAPASFEAALPPPRESPSPPPAEVALRPEAAPQAQEPQGPLRQPLRPPTEQLEPPPLVVALPPGRSAPPPASVPLVSAERAGALPEAHAPAPAARRPSSFTGRLAALAPFAGLSPAPGALPPRREGGAEEAAGRARPEEPPLSSPLVALSGDPAGSGATARSSPGAPAPGGPESSPVGGHARLPRAPLGPLPGGRLRPAPTSGALAMEVARPAGVDGTAALQPALPPTPAASRAALPATPASALQARILPARRDLDGAPSPALAVVAALDDRPVPTVPGAPERPRANVEAALRLPPGAARPLPAPERPRAPAEVHGALHALAAASPGDRVAPLPHAVPPAPSGRPEAPPRAPLPVDAASLQARALPPPRAAEPAAAAPIDRSASLPPRAPSIPVAPPQEPAQRTLVLVGERPPAPSPSARPAAPIPLPPSALERIGGARALVAPAPPLRPRPPQAGASGLLAAVGTAASSDGASSSGLLEPVKAASSFVPRVYQLRARARRQEALRLGGGDQETEEAVERGLGWLALHQSPDGRWSLSDYARHLEQPSRRDLFHADWDGSGRHDSRGGDSRAQNGDAGATGLALLAFLGHGDTHLEEGPYREVVERGLAFLLKRQLRDGDLRDGGNLYMHAVATFALTEAYAVTRAPELEEPARRAIRYTVRTQNPDLGGWRYEPYPQGRDVDTSVFGWMLMGIKSARVAGIEVEERAVQRMMRYLDSARMYTGRNRFDGGGRYAYQPGLPRTSLAMVAQGLFCQQVLLELLPPTDEAERRRLRKAGEESVSILLQNRPEPRDQDGTNYYYWYYATLALFQEDPVAWETWNSRLKRTLLDLQLREDTGSAAGSWDPVDARAQLGGRVFSTAAAVLSLEVYYRYAHREEAGGK